MTDQGMSIDSISAVTALRTIGNLQISFRFFGHICALYRI